MGGLRCIMQAGKPKLVSGSKESQMRLIAFPLVGVAALAGVVALMTPAANQEGAPIFVTDILPGYRDWRLISVAHEEGNLHSFSAILGNDLAIQAYREGKLPVPGRRDHCRSALPSRAVGGKQQSLWPGPIFRTRHPNKHSVYGQGHKKVRDNGRLGLRSLPGRQTFWRRDIHENLLRLPQSDQSARPCLHSLRTMRTTVR